jgi:mRNA-degrading endonuclease RelE of RelBE toxin-antitoxin system
MPYQILLTKTASKQLDDVLIVEVIAVGHRKDIYFNSQP